MNKSPDILREMSVPSELDAKILAVARLSAAGSRCRRRQCKLIALSGMAAVCAIGFAVLFAPGVVQPKIDMRDQALNDLTQIEQETYALCSALNSNRVYMFENSINLENL